MSARPTLPFTVAFATVTLLTILGDVLAIRWLHYGSKPLIMSLLLLYAGQQYRLGDSPGYVRWLLIGMVSALAGDVFLMIQEVDLFALGLGSFLVMQVFYSIIFRQFIRVNGRPLSIRSLASMAIPFALYSGLFLLFLKPAFDQNLALTGLWWPVVGYVVCLSTMGLMATQTQRSDSPVYGWILTGALLFILSDSIIAVDKFLFPVAGAPWFIMSTYAAAQYLIVIGLMRSIDIREHSR